MTTLFAGLLDDAAIYPPGNVPLEQAVRRHGEHASSLHASLLGSFVCSDRRWPELAALGSPLPLSLIATSLDSVPAAVADVVADGRFELRTVELAAGENVPAAARALAEALTQAGAPSDVTGYLELPLGPKLEAGLDRLAAAGLSAKFRTGGETPKSVPSEEALARGIAGCLDRELSFKLTAGLHHACRRRDTASGVERHGFLNVLLAVAEYPEGGGTDDIVDVLSERDCGLLATAAMQLPADTVDAVRTAFRSFGTCSIEEPVADLVELGLF